MKTIVVFSGAGLSKESGIPTFRDSLGGLWENYSVEEVASRDGWNRDPSIVLGFYASRWETLQKCHPNAAHLAIAELGRHFHVINVTQNVDDLLERAGVSDAIHLHGRLNSRKCEWHQSIFGDPNNPEFHCDYRVEHTAPVQLGDTCPRCGGRMRPDIVWFGESVDMRWEYFEQLAKSTDVFIGVGTSGQVEPAASLLSVFRPTKEKYFIDPAPPSQVTDYKLFTGTACQHLPDLVEQLKTRLA